MKNSWKISPYKSGSNCTNIKARPPTLYFSFFTGDYR